MPGKLTWRSDIADHDRTDKSCSYSIGYHYIANYWHPIKDTDEGLVEMFERRPEQGKHVRHRRVMPNRNW